MSTSPDKFEKLLCFWQSQVEKNLVPGESNQKLYTNNSEDLEPVEEKSLNPVPNEEFHQESLQNQSKIPQFKSELIIEIQLPKPVIVTTGVDFLSSKVSERPNLIQIQFNESNDNLLNTVAGENIYQDLPADKCNDGNDTSSIKSESSSPSANLSSDIETRVEDNSEEDFLDDDWFCQKNHIFVLSNAGKPIFSLNRLESKRLETFFSNFCMQSDCLISHFVDDRKDGILSIEAEGIKFVFFLTKTVYLVAVSRENISEYHLGLQLREVYNRIGFLLTLASLNSILEASPEYYIRPQLSRNFNLISNQLASNMTISNNIFTLFTDSVRVLPLHPDSRAALTKIIRDTCSKISKLEYAVLIVDDQLVVLVGSDNSTIHSADIRLIINLMQCQKNLMNNCIMWTLPICLPNFNENFYLYAYISRISDEFEAFLILLSFDSSMNEELIEVHKTINTKLHKHNWFKTICRQITNGLKAGNGFNLDVINVPELWHFLYVPKSSNRQLLCSKIIPPYTCMAEFKRLETIYRDLHSRIHNKSRPLELILEAKEKEVALGLKTDTGEIYAVFGPLINTISVANHCINELDRWIQKEKEVHLIQSYPKFKRTKELVRH